MISVEDLAQKQGRYCTYCKLRMSAVSTIQTGSMMTRDHHKARAEGGCNSEKNLVVACAICNQVKGKKDGERFARVVAKIFEVYPYAHNAWHSLEGKQLGDLEKLVIAMAMEDKYNTKPKESLERAINSHIRRYKYRIKRAIKLLEDH